jgi:hypothetical protein
MGQVYSPASGGIKVSPVDREAGPGAGPGATGNRDIFLGANAGQNNSLSDVIAVGNSAWGPAGGNTRASQAGTVVVGSGAAANLSLLAGSTSTFFGPDVIIGWQAAGSITDTGTQNFGGCVVIGAQAAQGGASENLAKSVIVGYQAAQVSAVNGGSVQQTIIGYQAAQTLGSTTSSCVVIGYNAGNGGHVEGSNNVWIGASTSGAVTGFSNSNDVLIGTGISSQRTGGNGNLIISGATMPVITGDGCIYICGTNIPPSITTLGTGDQFILGSRGNTLQWGEINNGNLCVGLSTSAGSRNFGGATNGFKLVDGTAPAANPNGGPVLYSQAGQLFVKSSGGIITTLGVSAAGQLAATVGTAYTNNAAAAAGTLANAPVAGNPTKWIPINDNGTIRNIPAW